MLIVTDQRERASDSISGDKLLEQRSRKLNILPGGAANDHMAGGSAIVVQILIGRDAKVKLVSFHGILLPAKPQPFAKARILDCEKKISLWD